MEAAAETAAPVMEAAAETAATAMEAAPGTAAPAVEAVPEGGSISDGSGTGDGSTSDGSSAETAAAAVPETAVMTSLLRSMTRAMEIIHTRMAAGPPETAVHPETVLAYTPDDVIIQGISSRYISESELYNYDLGTAQTDSK